MKYIKKVILENFQSHKYSEVEFDSQLNIIVGASDSGKTAIFRGIKWVLYNEPLGDFFVREGESECRVTVILNDGISVERYRSKSKNSYKLCLANGDEMIYEGFGHNVPYEVSEAIGIKSINLDQDKTRSVNLAEQLDGAFLLSESGSVKASSIGRLVGVNIIDDALRDSLSDSRKLSMEKKSMDTIVENLETELASYDYLSEIEEKLNKLKSIRILALEKQEKKERLVYLSKKYMEINYHKDENALIIEKTKKIYELQDCINKIENAYILYRMLELKQRQLGPILNTIELDVGLKEKLSKIHISDDILQKLDILIYRNNRLKNISRAYGFNLEQKGLMETKIYGLRDMENLENILLNLESRLKEYGKLLNMREIRLDITNRIGLGNAYVKKFDNIYGVENLIKNIEQMILNRKNMVDLSLSFKDGIGLKKDIEKQREINNKHMDDLLMDYRRLLSEHETCPFCLSHIDNLKVDGIIEIYREELKI